MRFLLDESADLPLAAYLADQGHDVTSIVRDHPRGIKDRDVLEIARGEQRVLITNDRDFGELVFRQHVPHAGVILFRLGDEELAVKAAWLQYVLASFSDRLSDFIVVSERGVRIRTE